VLSLHDTKTLVKLKALELHVHVQASTVMVATGLAFQNSLLFRDEINISLTK